MKRETILSDDRLHRFTLWRTWDGDLLTGCSDDLPNIHKFVNFIGLNPSTADEHDNDNTIRRCIDYARRWGYGALCMTNLFSLRTKNPEVMKASLEPTMESANEEYLLAVAREAALVVAAWGNDGLHLKQANRVRWLLKQDGARPMYLKLTSEGEPQHPLYLRKTLIPAGILA